MITFDDGYRGIKQFKNMLKEMNVFVKIFIITSKIGQENFLSKNEIISLKSDYNFTFGAHSHSHCPLISVSDDQLDFELKKSKEILSSILDEDIIDFAFPIGKFNKNVIEKALENKLINLYSTIPGNFQIKKSYLYRSLAQDLNVNQFKNLLFGGYDLFKIYYQVLSSKLQ